MTQFTIITGLSGSGKTQAIRFLEDEGFFCIDNMPPMLIPQVAEVFVSMNGKYEKIAFVIDIRLGELINELLDNIKWLRDSGYECKLLFLNADDETLVKRYKETRRTHPLSGKKGLLDSIKRERKALEKLYLAADFVIDTSNISSQQLHSKLNEIYKDKENDNNIVVNISAFGFKYGIPLDSDLVFDVRCFPNPFYIDNLKEKTGLNKEVRDYVMSFKPAKDFFEKLKDMILSLLPLYIEEGKNTLSISIGCTGGKHRSVTIAKLLGKALKENDYKVNIIYRDIEKGV